LALVVAGTAALGVLAGCGGPATPADAGPGGEGVVGTADATAASATATPSAVPSPSSSDTTGHSAGNPLACSQLPNARVGSAALPLADFEPITVQLSAGRYNGADGAAVELQDPCGIGDLNGDGVFDAMGSVKISRGIAGQFHVLVAWLSNNSGTPQLAGSAALGDRNWVESIEIADGEATVVYYTRTPEAPMAMVNIKRTAIYELTAAGLVEVSHTDAPYTP
jgi:hypothetical protein